MEQVSSYTLRVSYQSGASSSPSSSPSPCSDPEPVIDILNGVFQSRLKTFLFQNLPHNHVSIPQADLEF